MMKRETSRRLHRGQALRRSPMALLLNLCLFLVLAVATEESSFDQGPELNSILSGTTPPTCEIDCQCPHLNLARNDDSTLKESTTGARLAYLITVHNQRTAEDAAFLFRAIRSPQNIVIVHVDTKFDWEDYKNTLLHYEMQACPCGTRIHEDSVHSAEWSSWSMNDPTFWGMEIAQTRFKGEWDVFLNLSGDTMPVFTANVMAQYFDPKTGPLRGINFVTSSSCETGLLPSNVYIFPKFWHKRAHYTTHPEGDPIIEYEDDHGKLQEISMEIHFGSQWMALLPNFVEYLVESLKRPKSLPSRFKSYLIDTERLMTDETFIPTLLMHVPPFNETLPDIDEEGQLKTLPSMSAIRYERMDEHSPSAFGVFPTVQHYDVPNSSDAAKPRVWGPYFLGVYDFMDIKLSGALFVRKVSVAVDPNIVHMLPVTDINDLPSVQWPKEVSIIDKPDWDALKQKIKDEMRKKKKREANAQK